MAKTKQIGAALTALGMIGAITACASPMNKAYKSSSFGGKVNSGAVGVATRAQMAVQEGKFAEAIPFAEKAVENSPQDAGFRALLGNAYFGAGRFASAESAYRDALTIYPSQPQVVLKLALVSIAQGKGPAAVGLLTSARDMLDPSDYGLAMALAGQPADAVAILNDAARNAGADSRVRQNLALAHALSGDWDSARVVAAQDLPADQLEGRIQQWMAIAQPKSASDQVVAITGIAPAAVDPGLPSRLALQVQGDNRFAALDNLSVAPAVEPSPVEIAPISVAPQTIDIPAPLVVPEAPVIHASMPAPVAVAAAEPAPKPSLSPRAVSMSEESKLMRRAAAPRPLKGASKTVVQLGAYGSKDFVPVAWAKVAKKYPALRGYTPTTARFNSAHGLVYRLSVGGFESDHQARDFCMSLKRAGGNCFVRTVAGDAPVRLAAL